MLHFLATTCQYSLGVQTPTSKFGVRMSTVLGCNPSCKAFGLSLEKPQLQQLTGSESGCGCMRLCNLKREKIYWWLLPYVNSEQFNWVLKDFAEQFKLDKNKRMILPLDQAGWHTSEKLQPAERLWLLVNEPLVNQVFNSIAEVEKLVYQRCQRLLQQ